MSHTVCTFKIIFWFEAAKTTNSMNQCRPVRRETGRQSRTHLEELGVGDDDDEEDDRDNVGDGDDGDDCGCDSDWQEAEVTLLPREEMEVLRLL